MLHKIAVLAVRPSEAVKTAKGNAGKNKVNPHKIYAPWKIMAPSI
jgi:hypothetical protein